MAGSLDKRELLEARVDRLESAEAIRQLASRYGHAVDLPDLDQIAELYVEDVKVGAVGANGEPFTHVGRDALKQWFASTPSFGRSRAHFIGNHVIEFTGPDSATGVVYCQGSSEQSGGSTWRTVLLKYKDRYVRRQGRWYFLSRYATGWYSAEFPVSSSLDALAALQAAFPET